MEIIVRPAEIADIEKILHYSEEYGLDCEDLNYEQFYIAEIQNEIAGFGRIKQYGEVCELASLGVLEKFRKNGIGKKIVAELINTAPFEDIRITTVIPEYFEQFGFVKDDNVPDALLLKSRRVCEKLNRSVKNPCFMHYKKKNCE